MKELQEFTFRRGRPRKKQDKRSWKLARGIRYIKGSINDQERSEVMKLIQKHIKRML